MGFALHDFGRVTAAMQDYACATGESPLPLGGWEVADTAICPPLWLVKRLCAVKAQPEGYAYLKDFRLARAKAAQVFGGDVRFDGVPLAEEHVAMMPNSSQALLLALTAWREAGVRHVIVAAPCYYATLHICHHLGLAVTLVPAADYLTGALDLAAIARAMDRPHTALIVTNPAYSLGVTYGRVHLSALTEILPARSYLLLDETRLGLSWEDKSPWYVADYPPQTLVLRSPSKIFLLNGVKTSFLLGMPSLLRAAERFGEALLGSVAGNAESVALIYLAAWQEWRTEVRRNRQGRFCTWRDGIIASLRRNLLACNEPMVEYGLSLSPIDSGPYALAALPRERGRRIDSAAIARATGVMLMTSEYFYHEHPDWVGFRLNLCGDGDQAREAIHRVMAHVLLVASRSRCALRLSR